jgi:hypothetical protein
VPKIEIFFLDRNYQPTTDGVTGTPSVYATVAIDGMEVMSGRPAVVDTGADFCIINADELSLFRDQVRPADKSKIEQSRSTAWTSLCKRISSRNTSGRRY